MEQLKIINFMLYANMRMEARLLLHKLPKGVESSSIFPEFVANSARKNNSKDVVHGIWAKLVSDWE